MKRKMAIIFCVVVFSMLIAACASTGATTRVNIAQTENAHGICRFCNVPGSGLCAKCQGVGYRVAPIIQLKTTCSECHGTGKCSYCQGTGRL